MLSLLPSISFFFFFNDTATTEIYTLSLHDALPISHASAPLPGKPYRSAHLFLSKASLPGEPFLLRPHLPLSSRVPRPHLLLFYKPSPKPPPLLNTRR